MPHRNPFFFDHDPRGGGVIVIVHSMLVPMFGIGLGLPIGPAL